jgi:hypothetical protein
MPLACSAVDLKVLLGGEQRVPGGVKVLGRLEHGLRGTLTQEWQDTQKARNYGNSLRRRATSASRPPAAASMAQVAGSGTGENWIREISAKSD